MIAMSFVACFAVAVLVGLRRRRLVGCGRRLVQQAGASGWEHSGGMRVLGITPSCGLWMRTFGGR